MSPQTILIVDDDYGINASLGLLFKRSGYASVCATNPDEALTRLADHEIALVLQDMNFSRRTTGEEGLALLAEIKKQHPRVPVVLITAWGSIDLAVAGLKAGATDFVTKPWSNAQILQRVTTALDLAQADTPAVSADRMELDGRHDFTGVIGNDPQLLSILDLLGRVSDTEASILITGDSGTGKEVMAEAVHRNSRRCNKPFVKVNLGGVASSVFESEMFGHVRGAFTDAHKDREGRFALAEGGTIFLDEIGELDLRDQVKMLRVLQDRTYEVLGSSQTRTMDVRIIAATNRDLTAAVAAGGFREDLLYRLNLISVDLPPLQKRPDDIPLLARHFLSRAIVAYNLQPVQISDAALDWLQAQPWPGNVRQLKHVIERAALVAETDHLDTIHFQHPAQSDTADNVLPPVGQMTMDDLEEAMVRKTLDYHQGNISRAAEALGFSRAALYRRLEKYGIQL